MRAQTYALEKTHAFCCRFILAAAEHLDLCQFEIPHNSEMREQLEMLKHHADAGAQLRQVGLGVADGNALRTTSVPMECFRRADQPNAQGRPPSGLSGSGRMGL
jgi:hypothetical protein